jgi:hypothetical protein
VLLFLGLIGLLSIPSVSQDGQLPRPCGCRERFVCVRFLQLGPGPRVTHQISFRQWRLSSSRTPSLVSTCGSAMPYYPWCSQSMTRDPILISSWEFVTTLDYEWSIIWGRRPYRWTIWVCDRRASFASHCPSQEPDSQTYLCLR